MEYLEYTLKSNHSTSSSLLYFVSESFYIRGGTIKKEKLISLVKVIILYLKICKNREK
jgi:hypothetical protein